MHNSRCGPGTSMPLLVKITLKVDGLGWPRCQYHHELKDCHHIDFRYHIIITPIYFIVIKCSPSWLSSNLVTNEIIITIVVTMLSLTQLTWNMITNMIIITIVVITSSLTRLASNMITNMLGRGHRCRTWYLYQNRRQNGRKYWHNRTFPLEFLIWIGD